ncbi:DUF3087 family protein [Shewanella sp. Isolate8]|uniref:DUF3087 family protein n=1 Tax=Shewanella sp. Isolate8 TaxID=2908529 RepID=UPI001EFE637B|nr:DUF3087 family protein [Shewanella sp. Isolate8]MCG9745240.1 DUF3087 domain-containing protein [Shewanella sp. Isolate8]
MMLVEVDKARYRQHLNRVIAVFIASLALLSLISGQLLIALFGNQAVVSGESTGNLHLNFLGVLLGFAVCAWGLYQQRHKDYFREIYYVSRLKALQNRIYRKFKQIKQAGERNDIDALTIQMFYFSSQKLVYLLDDNTLTLSQVDKELEAVKARIAALGLNIGPEGFDESLLEKF